MLYYPLIRYFAIYYPFIRYFAKTVTKPCRVSLYSRWYTSNACRIITKGWKVWQSCSTSKPSAFVEVQVSLAPLATHDKHATLAGDAHATHANHITHNSLTAWLALHDSLAVPTPSAAPPPPLFLSYTHNLSLHLIQTQLCLTIPYRHKFASPSLSRTIDQPPAFLGHVWSTARHFFRSLASCHAACRRRARTRGSDCGPKASANAGYVCALGSDFFLSLSLFVSLLCLCLSLHALQTDSTFPLRGFDPLTSAH